jgi:hypothetical protein
VIAVCSDADETGSAKHGQVLRHGSERDGEVGRDVAGRTFAVPHQPQDLPPTRVPDHLERIHVAILASLEMAATGGYCSAH